MAITEKLYRYIICTQNYTLITNKDIYLTIKNELTKYRLINLMWLI